MLKKQRKTGKGLIAILIVSYLLFAIFAGGYVWFGLAAAKTADADINGGLLSFVKYTFADPALFFTFKVRGVVRILQLVLPGLFYAFVFIFVLYFIVGIIVGVKKHRGISAAALIAVFLSVVAYFIAATDASKFLAVIANVDPLKDAGITMAIPSVMVLFSIVFFILFSYIAFFMSLVEAIKNPKVEEKPAEENASEQAPQAKENQEAPAAEIAYTEEPVMFEEIEEPQMEFEPLPEPEVPAEEKAEEEPAFTEEPKEEKPAEDKDDLKSLLREVVRDIVRDEIARNNANQPRSDFNPLAGGSITGATFGGPLVVQYFNGGINSPAAAQAQPAEPAPAPQPEPKAEPQPAPAPVEEKPEPQPVEEKPEPQPEPVVEEQPAEEPQPEPAPVVEEVEPAPEEAPVEEPVAEPEPVVEEQPVEEPQPEPAPEEQPAEEAAPVEAPVEEKKPIIRIPFTERMINADEEMKKNYNELKNEILSYGVNSRVSNSGDTFRLHRVTYVKITIAGLSLKLYFALNPDDYKDSTLPIQNAGHKGIYAEIPLVFKVKSGLSMRRCKQLIQDLMDKNGLEQGEIKDIDWVEQLKNEPEGESEE